MAKLGESSDVIARIKAKTIYDGDCWIFTGKTSGKGYGCIWYEQKTVRINRLIAHLYHGMDLDDPIHQGNHKPECRYKSCWNPDHIYVGSQRENVKDSIEKGTFHYGTSNLKNGNVVE